MACSRDVVHQETMLHAIGDTHGYLVTSETLSSSALVDLGKQQSALPPLTYC